MLDNGVKNYETDQKSKAFMDQIQNHVSSFRKKAKSKFLLKMCPDFLTHLSYWSPQKKNDVKIIMKEEEKKLPPRMQSKLKNSLE